jgi:hypothetical protein
LSKVKEIKRLCGDVAGYVAQSNAPIDAEIGQKDHLWMETNYHYSNIAGNMILIYFVNLLRY